MNLLKKLFLTVLVGPAVLACSPRAETMSPEVRLKMEAAIAEGQRRSDVRYAFSQTHPYKGKIARDFVRDLQGEGFSCQLQYRSRIKVGTGAEMGAFSTQTVPVVECFTKNYEVAICKEFRVSIGLGSADPIRPLKLIAEELDSIVVDRAYFICESTPLTDAEEALVAEGIREGYVIPLAPGKQ